MLRSDSHELNEGGDHDDGAGPVQHAPGAPRSESEAESGVLLLGPDGRLGIGSRGRRAANGAAGLQGRCRARRPLIETVVAQGLVPVELGIRYVRAVGVFGEEGGVLALRVAVLGGDCGNVGI